jgi:hypothetical protein
VHGWPRLWLALAVSAPLILALGRLLPAEGLGLALRLAGAAGCVLLLPGACFVRLLGERSAGIQFAGAIVWSLVGVFAILAVVFAVGASLGLAVALLGILTLAVFAISLRATQVPLERADGPALVGVFLLGSALAVALWWATGTIGGSVGPGLSDALFHLARIRKLDQAGSLESIDVVSEFAKADLHPGYAFPLWHGALALIARLAGVDPTLVVLYLPVVLAPLALLIAYGAGRALFRSTAGGVATALGWLALAAFPFGGVGRFLAQPGGASRYLLVPALLALFFAYVVDGRLPQVAGVAAASFAVAVIHPTYVLFVALPLGGFLLARGILGDGSDLRRIGAGLAALVLPAGIFFLWLRQFIGEAEHWSNFRFPGQLEAVGSTLRLSADQLAWGGGPKLLALAAVPLALLAGGRRWAAWVLGGSLVVLLVALLPPLFDPLAAAVSVAQATRLAGFLPLAFALAGAALLAGRLRVPGVVCAALAALAVEVAVDDPASRAGWIVWAAAIGAALGLAVFGFARPLVLDGKGDGRWQMIAAVALALPAAVAGFSNYERWNRADPDGLTPGFTEALRAEVPPLDLVLAPSPTSYRIAGYAPLRVVITPPGHFAFNAGPDYRARDAAVRLFFAPGASTEEREEVLRRYAVGWVTVDRARGSPSLPSGLTEVYADERYVLYRVERRQEQT